MSKEHGRKLTENDSERTSAENLKFLHARGHSASIFPNRSPRIYLVSYRKAGFAMYCHLFFYREPVMLPNSGNVTNFL